jgi:hypothetical protein
MSHKSSETVSMKVSFHVVWSSDFLALSKVRCNALQMSNVKVQQCCNSVASMLQLYLSIHSLDSLD